MLDYRVETFLAVCKHMNYTKAADALAITQPAVSQHIKALEREYDIKAFSVEGKRVRITPEGEKLRQALSTMDQDVRYLKKSLQTKERPAMAFGVTLTVGEFIIRDKIGNYLSKHPDVSLKMIVANTAELLDMLDEGSIDIALVEGYYPKARYDHLTYSKEKYIAVCSRAHPLAKGSVSLDRVIKETLIAREAGSGTREILQRALETQNYKIRDFAHVIEVSSLNVIKSFVEKNCGISFMYQAAVSEEIKNKTLHKINIRDFNVSHDISFVWRKNSMFAAEYREIFKDVL